MEYHLQWPVPEVFWDFRRLMIHVTTLEQYRQVHTILVEGLGLNPKGGLNESNWARYPYVYRSSGTVEGSAIRPDPSDRCGPKCIEFENFLAEYCVPDMPLFDLDELTALL